MTAQLATPFRGLLVALAAAYLAYLWYHNHRVWAVVLTVLACLVGWVLNAIGKGLLPDRPVAALRFLEGWILTPAAVAAAAGALVVIVTVALTVPDGTATSTKETIAALSTGLTAFLTSGFISWTSDSNDSPLSSHIRDAFYASYKRADGSTERGVDYFAPESRGEQLVYSDEVAGVEGWGRPARLKRAQGIAAELSSRV